MTDNGTMILEDGHWDQSDHNLLSNVKKTSTKSNFDEGEVAEGRYNTSREHWSALECYFIVLATLLLQFITKPCVQILSLSMQVENEIVTS